MKNNLRLIIACLVFQGAYNAFGQNVDTVSCISHHKAREIPKNVISEIKRHYKTRFSLAEPTEKYQDTDVISKRGLKDRRLAFWARCGAEFFLVYDHGGYAFHRHVIVLIETNRKYKIVTNLGAGDAQDIKGVQKVIAAGKSRMLDHF